jgi:dienelactone hydrolase
MRRLLPLLVLLLVVGPRAAAAPGEIVPSECLVLEAVGRGGRTAVHVDSVEAQIVAGRWKAPKAGEAVAAASGGTRTWTSLAAKEPGVFESRALQGGYAFVPVQSAADRVMLLEAAGDNLAYVNGEPRAGDPYQNGYVRLPVRLRAGTNELLFLCGRGSLRVKLTPAPARALLNTGDMTLPDLVVGQKLRSPAAVVVLNADTRPLAGVELQASISGGRTTRLTLPPVPPLSVRKVGFDLVAPAATEAGERELRLALIDRRSRAGLDSATVKLRVRSPGQTRKVTFRSEIDGSVQYYALNPAPPGAREHGAPALFLSLHGAGVEAIGQADAYSPKRWGDLVAPTNRRPYGFDWEDWGRMDALEVLDLARKHLGSDPRRIYLTGHSMGGHGTWQLGATFPDCFAAIGPSAGWISFASYGGGPQPRNPDPLQAMLLRASASSDTLAMSPNYGQEGIYVLHGDADDNVPVTEAREMTRHLAAFHRDWTLFEQPGVGHWWDASDEPGADCVDWAPMFDFFSRRQLPGLESVRRVEFVTLNPGVSSRCHWAEVEAQVYPLQPSSVSLRLDPGQRRFAGSTANVARLSLDLAGLAAGSPVHVELDGRKLGALPWPAAGTRLTFVRDGERWMGSGPAAPSLKGPGRAGPFKEAFRHRFELVYGTRGTAEENAWALAKARFDAETFWYRGNGSVDVLPDTAFDPSREPDRGVVLYGSRETNAAWEKLLGDSPVQVSRGRITVGERTFSGGDLSCLFLRPRPGSDVACVAVVAGTGLAGMRLTDRLPIFLSGAGFPDCLVLGSEVLEKGTVGILGAGLFGNDWSVKTGEFAWRE